MAAATSAFVILCIYFYLFVCLFTLILRLEPRPSCQTHLFLTFYIHMGEEDQNYRRGEI